MTPLEKLKQLASSTPPPPRIIIVCPDYIRKTRALEYTLNLLCKDKVAIQRYDAAAISQENLYELRDSSQTLSLFASQKFVVIKNIDKAPAAIAKELEQLVLNDKGLNTYICSASGLTSKSVFLKANNKDFVVELPKLEGEEVLKWTAQEIKRQGYKEADTKVTKMIAGMCLDDLDQIYSLVEKLSLYCDGETIGTADVQELDSFKEIVQEFNFVNLLASGKKTASLAFIEELKNSESGIFPLMGLLSKMFSNYLRIKVAKANGHGEAQVSKELGLAPWAYKKQLDISNLNSELKLIRFIKAICRADSQIKNKNLGENAVLTELIANAS